MKRGVHELMLSGPAVETVVEPLLEMLDGERTAAQIVGSFPADLQPDVESVLRRLLARRLITHEPEPDGPSSGVGSLEQHFYWNLGEQAEEAMQRMRAARILVVGANLISRSLVRSVLEMGVGRVILADHPTLDNHLVPFDPAFPAGGGGERLERVDTLPSEGALEELSLLCASCDFGETEALLEINRLGLRLERPFLPVWLAELRGHVGPLNHPFETACLRCYRARADSHDPHHDVSRAIRRHVTGDSAARDSAGFLPPMTGILGEIAAMEVAKHLTGLMPTDTIGRHIEVNLVSFSSTVRRVLKIPRCPECSDVMSKAAAALTSEPAIPIPE